jgi:hypothetical protein
MGAGAGGGGGLFDTNKCTKVGALPLALSPLQRTVYTCKRHIFG